ncbi:uncharacterized protein NDAI_0E00920 [Naumovozyma dairenensis CBS 421]|uniref:Hyphally-regulated cell wall protein N-terminal domain-containing protein n=1 Tax=Naumovozyma dairenensis (strain ATCC 10597 / BCRC 20456 / CBS 421 / NBRC 0211 / NRRL Y-12639) TaxID=1071378 RepID=G0WAY8_NAUDC|nr:hypothetical protein NDAI_0E00920 [Naumovozyma dairenensis CBS 421]CCD24908.1 hypothetical protein NDAI_0E00920 [Naumovozyma dairenensis CBS 421]
MKAVVLKVLFGLLVTAATSSAVLQVSSDTLYSEQRTIVGDVIVMDGSSLLITHDPELGILSGTISNNGNLCIGTTDTTSIMSIDILATNIENKGNLIIDNGVAGDKTTTVKVASLDNSGNLLIDLKDSMESLTVTNSFVNTGYMSLSHVTLQGYDGVFTFKGPTSGITNSGTIDVSGTNITIDYPISGGGCIYGNEWRTDLTVNTNYQHDQTFWMQKSDRASSITLLGAGKYIPVIRGFNSGNKIQFGRNIQKYDGTITTPSYNPDTGIVTTSNMYGTFQIDIGKGYDGSKIKSEQSNSCPTVSDSSCYAPALTYGDDAVEPAAATERPTSCASRPDLSMAICSTVLPSLSSFPSSYSTSHISTGISSTTNNNGQCVKTETSTSYFSTLHTTTYFYSKVSTITAPRTRTFITTYHTKI